MLPAAKSRLSVNTSTMWFLVLEVWLPSSGEDSSRLRSALVVSSACMRGDGLYAGLKSWTMALSKAFSSAVMSSSGEGCEDASRGECFDLGEDGAVDSSVEGGSGVGGDMKVDIGGDGGSDGMSPWSVESRLVEMVASAVRHDG